MALHDAMLEELGLAPRWVRRGMGGADGARQGGALDAASTDAQALAADDDAPGMARAADAAATAVSAGADTTVDAASAATTASTSTAAISHGRDAVPPREPRRAAEPVAAASAAARTFESPVTPAARDTAMQRPPSVEAARRAGFDASSAASDPTANAPDEDMSWFDAPVVPVVDDASLPLADEASNAPIAARAQIATLDWDALAGRVAGCRACGLCEKRTNTVFGVGDRAAEWMLIGEAPGENEDRQGEPFVGQAGKLLDNMLKSLALARGENVYIANVIKCRPPGNRNPEPEEVARCEPYLQRQVALVKPKLIVAMGRFAAQSLLRTEQSISALRGRVHEYEGVPVVVTYHPAYLLRSLPDKAKAWADLCLARTTWQNAARGQDA